VRRIFGAGVVIAIVALGVFMLGRPPEPAALPEGAVQLALRTTPPEWSVPGLPKGCPLAEVSPVRLVREGESLVFDLAESAQRIHLVFPYGFTARLAAGRGELVSPAGAVIARDGDVLSGLMGESADIGDFILCFDAATKVLVTPASTAAP
jgi:hypothetical protein